MSYYNHFALEKYMAVGFADLKIGEKFRKDLFKGKRRRKDIVMIKTGELCYMEYIRKKHYTLVNPNIYMKSYDKLKPNRITEP